MTWLGSREAILEPAVVVNAAEDWFDEQTPCSEADYAFPCLFTTII